MSDSPWSEADGPTLPDGERTLVGGPPAPPAPAVPSAPDDPTWPATPPVAPPTASTPAAVAPAAAPPPPTAPPQPPLDRTPWPYGERGTSAGRGRTLVGVFLLFVAGLMAVSAIAAAWTRQQIKDEDTWAATADALADDPAVQQAVADALAVQIISVTGADDLISGVLPGPLGALSGPLTDRATDLVSLAALELVQTEVFRNAWEAAVRSSHQELLAAIDGNGRVTTISPEGIELDLGSTLGSFRDLLDERGLTFLDGIDLSGIDVQFLLVDAPGLLKLRDTLEVLDGIVMLNPILAFVATVAGLAIARRRSWAVVAGGLGVMVGAALVVVLANAGRNRAAQEFSGGVLGPAAVEVVADQVFSSLQTTMLAVGLVGVAILLLGGIAMAATTRRA